MRILLLGSTGAVGGGIAEALTEFHQRYRSEQPFELIRAGRSSQTHQVDVFEPGAVQALLAELTAAGPLDAVAAAIGEPTPAPLLPDAGTAAAALRSSLERKAMLQIELALQAAPLLSPGGSLTLTSGIVGEAMVSGGVPGAVANAAIEAFVRASAQELAPVRINVVNPAVLEPSAELYGGNFPGLAVVSQAGVAQAFVRSVYGVESGQVYRAWGGAG